MGALGKSIAGVTCQQPLALPESAGAYLNQLL